nr:DciA family protein [uncultured Acetobacter sp.]
MTKESSSGKATTRKTPSAAKKADVPPAPPRRAMTARSLAALLPNVTAPAFKKRSPAGAQLFTDWIDIVGPAHAAVTTPRKLSAGTLSIACAGPVAMELQHLSDTLIARINTWCGQPLVARLRFVQDPTAAQRFTARRTLKAATKPCHLPEMEDSPLREALESLGAHILHKKAGR